MALLESVPWLVIAAFAGSAVLAVAAGRASAADPEIAAVAVRTVDVLYAFAVGVVVALRAVGQFAQ